MTTTTLWKTGNGAEGDRTPDPRLAKPGQETIDSDTTPLFIGARGFSPMAGARQTRHIGPETSQYLVSPAAGAS